jgi:hypothetical protein
VADDEAPEAVRPKDGTRPPFTHGYPRDPALDRLVTAFSRGNHRLVRDEAETLARRTDDPLVAAAARDLRRRLEPDRLAYVLLGTTAVLLLALTAWALRESKTHDHNRPPAATTGVKTVQTVK